MKARASILSFLFACFTVSACLSLGCGGGKLGPDPTDGGVGSGPADGGVQLEPTAKGTATGPSVTSTIGPSGGTLTSADGAVTITVPAGAVAAATEFGILPITNEAPAGLGQAYRLTPHGLTFSQPIKLSFRYLETELMPESLGIAFQDDNGVWWGRLDSAFEEDTQKISVQITHFSDWVKVTFWIPPPRSARVPVGDKFKLQVFACVLELGPPYPYSPNSDADLLAPLVATTAGCRPSIRVGIWKVNEIEGGNGTVGTIRVLSDGPGDPEGLLSPLITSKATYTAPAKVPNPNPVHATGDLKWVERKVTKRFSTAITIVEQRWEGDFTADLSQGTGASQHMTAHVVFKLDPSFSDPSIERWRPSEGTVSWSVSGNSGPCTNAGEATAQVKPGDGVLDIMNGSPPQYRGGGQTDATVTWSITCPSVTTVVPWPLPPWFAMENGSRVMSESTTLSGTFSLPPGSTWHWTIKKL